EIGFLGGHQIPKIRLHRGDVRLRLGVGELRDRDGGQDTDDHHHDQQLNERETLAIHLTLLPLEVHLMTTHDRVKRNGPPVGDASPVPCVTKNDARQVAAGCYTDGTGHHATRDSQPGSGLLQGLGLTARRKDEAAGKSPPLVLSTARLPLSYRRARLPRPPVRAPPCSRRSRTSP